MRKLFLPNTEKLSDEILKEDLFCIRFSDNGAVITLNKFGYKGIHITIYIKDVDEVKQTFTINAHLTKEGNPNEQLVTIEKLIDMKKIEQYFLEKKERFIRTYLNFDKSLRNKFNSKRIVCCQCASKNLQLNFSTKQSTIESFNKLANFGFTPEDIQKYHSCQEYKHNPHYHIKKKIMLYKFGNKYCTEKQMKRFSKQMEKIFLESYENFEKELDDIKVQFEQAMKQYKV